MNITLTVIEGPQKGKKLEFSEPDNFLLGRDNKGWGVYQSSGAIAGAITN